MLPIYCQTKGRWYTFYASGSNYLKVPQTCSFTSDSNLFIHSSITLLFSICKLEPPGKRTHKAWHLFSTVLSCFSPYHKAVDTNKDIKNMFLVVILCDDITKVFYKPGTLFLITPRLHSWWENNDFCLFTILLFQNRHIIEWNSVLWLIIIDIECNSAIKRLELVSLRSTGGLTNNLDQS